MAAPGPLLVEGPSIGRGAAQHASAAPGVSVEWLGPLLRQLDRRRSDVAGFVGFAERGPVNKPRRLATAAEFDATYGTNASFPFLRYAVHGYFANGGRVCWAVRAAHKALSARLTTGGLTFEASTEGAWANGVSVQISPTGGEQFDLDVQSLDGRQERWRSLTFESINRINYTEDNGGLLNSSALIVVKVDPKQAATAPTPFRGELAGGDDGLEHATVATLSGLGPNVSADENIALGVRHFSEIEEIGIVVIPDLVTYRPPAMRRPSRRLPCTGQSPQQPRVAPLASIDPSSSYPSFQLEEIADAQADLIGYCTGMGDRIVLLAHPLANAELDDVVQWRGRFRSAFGAIYWPWITIQDGSRTIDLPPTGHLAGIIARNDLAVGPHKPPANERIVGAIALTRPCDDDTHGRANNVGINVIRADQGRGIRVLGARTLSDAREWRYINVRRLFSYIEEVISALGDEVVFRPNNSRERDRIERAIRHYLDGLWKAGVLDGSNAESAFSVEIEDSGAGGPRESEMIVNVGLQPPWPGEFVVVRINLGVPDTALDTREESNGADR
jgi:uncharacterized protein